MCCQGDWTSWSQKMTEHKYAVYMHIFPNKKKYIGITGQKPKERWRVNGNGYKPRKKPESIEIRLLDIAEGRF